MSGASASQKRFFTKRHYPVFWVAGLMLTAVAILGFSMGSASRMATHHNPMVDAAMEIKYHAAEAHLWFEEAVTQGEAEDLAMFRDHLSQAKWYARAMVDGGEDRHGKFIPLSDPQLRSEIEDVLQILEQFDSIAMKRWALRDLSGVGTEADQRFDVVFRSLINGTVQVEIALQQAIEKELHRFRQLQGGLMGLVFFLGILVAVVLHVYERQKQMRARTLQQSEENLAITLNSIGDGVIASDIQGRVTHLNPVAEKLTGWSQEEAAGRPVEEVFHIVNVFSRERVENPGQRALREGTVVGLANHTVLINRHGTEAHIADSASPIRNLDGEITGVVLVFRDVTELYAKEEALRRREKKYRTFFENSADAMLILEGTEFIDCNNATAILLGYDEKRELLNTHPSKLSPEFQPDGQSSFEKAEQIMALAREKGSHRFEWVHLRKDGEEIPIEVSLTAIDNGQGIQLHTVWRDLTERKRAEEALRASEEKYRGLVEASSDWIWELDAEGKFSYSSPQVEKILGYKPEELIGESPYAPMSAEEKERVQNLFETAWQNALPVVSMENINLHKDGHEVVMETSGSPIFNEAGEVVGYRGIDRDITERKQAEGRIQQQRHLLERAQELGQLGTWELDLKQNELRWTDENCRIFGVPTGSKVTYEIFLEKVHPDDRDYVHREWAAALNGAPYDIEHRLWIDGNAKWVRQKADVDFDENGMAVNAIGFTQDITERKQAEEALRESAQKLALHVKQTPLAVVEWDTNFEVTEWNPAAESMFGYSRAEALGQHATFIVPEAVRDQVAPVLRELLTNTGGSRSTNENITRAGERIFCEWYNTTLIDNQGEVIGVASLVMDVTARKKAEEESARLMQAIEQAEEIVVITDAEANIQYVNSAFERTTGYSWEEARGQNPRILQSGQHSGMFYRKMWDTLTAGRPWSGQLINKRKDGTIYTEEANISPVIDGNGKIVNYVAAKRDATHELELEKQLRQAQKMEAVGQMAGGIAHDFNNLLQVISGYAELSEMSLKPGDEHASAITEIGKAAERGKGLINQLLAFSRRQVIQPIDLDLNDLIEPLLKMMRGLIGEHIELDFIASRELGTIHADRGLMEQVLMNLCVNARDAMPEGGKLTIETENVLIDGDYARIHAWAAPGRYVLLNVTDTGCGMDRRTREHIFEPFFTTKEVGKGTGLGLSTVFGIVKQHNGHITTYSEIDKGTIFKIYLPTVARNAAEVSRAPRGAVAGGTETILIAEDDETVLVLAEHLLTSAGYTVLTAVDGEDAIRVFEENSKDIDAVMFDVVMPRMGGKQALERILEMRPGLPHLFASGYSENAVHTNFIQKRGLHLLSKPYQTETLLRKIREVLDEA